MSNINKLMDSLFESALNYGDSLNNIYKNLDKEQKKYDKASIERNLFLQNVIGKPLYNKFASLSSTGTFSPFPVDRVGLTHEDIVKFLTKNNLEPAKVYKFYDEWKSKYRVNQIRLIDDNLMVGVTFRSFDDVIDFFANIFAAVKKVYRIKGDETGIDWQPIVTKFRKNF